MGFVNPFTGEEMPSDDEGGGDGERQADDAMPEDVAPDEEQIEAETEECNPFLEGEENAEEEEQEDDDENDSDDDDEEEEEEKEEEEEERDNNPFADEEEEEEKDNNPFADDDDDEDEDDDPVNSTERNPVYREDGKRLYGLDAEIEQRRQAARDPQNEANVVQWIQQVTGERLSHPDNVRESLKSGRLLCKLLNKIKAGTVKFVNEQTIALAETENLAVYTEGCKTLGVESYELFTPFYLHSGTDMIQVYLNLNAVARVAYLQPSFKGPYFGPKPSTRSKKAKKWKSVATVARGGQRTDGSGDAKTGKTTATSKSKKKKSKKSAAAATAEAAGAKIAALTSGVTSLFTQKSSSSAPSSKPSSGASTPVRSASPVPKPPSVKALANTYASASATPKRSPLSPGKGSLGKGSLRSGSPKPSPSPSTATTNIFSPSTWFPSAKSPK